MEPPNKRLLLFVKLLIQLVREILHLSGKSQGKVREFQTPMAVATMLSQSESMQLVQLCCC